MEVNYSIVIPAYNVEKYIGSCLDSVRGQRYTRYEVIVVDDGSTDSTKAVVENYIRTYPEQMIRYFYQENAGPAAARYMGVQQAAYEYVAFLDADDVWYPEKLETVTESVLAHPEATVFYSDENEVGLEGNIIPCIYRKLIPPYFDDLLLRGNALSTSTVVARREDVIACCGLKNEVIGGEDYRWWLELACNGAVFFHIDKVLGEYRRNQESLTFSSALCMQNMGNIAIQYLDKLDKSVYSEKQIQAYKKSMQKAGDYLMARYYHITGRFREAGKYYRKAFSVSKRGIKAFILCVLALLHIRK